MPRLSYIDGEYCLDLITGSSRVGGPTSSAICSATYGSRGEAFSRHYTVIMPGTSVAAGKQKGSGTGARWRNPSSHQVCST